MLGLYDMSLLKYINYCGLGVIGCCFKNRRGFIPGQVYDGKEQNSSPENLVLLDTSLMGMNIFLCVICIAMELGSNIVANVIYI